MFTQVQQRAHSDYNSAVAVGGAAPRNRSCPSPARCLMQLVRYPHRHRQPRDADSRQPGDDPDMTESGQSKSSCCGYSGSDGGRLAAIVDACAASSALDRCRLPRCKWWKSLCTRVYLIAVNLASFVSSSLCSLISYSKAGNK